MLGLRYHEEVFQDHLIPFDIGSSENRTGDPTSQVGEMTKSSPRSPYCELWVWFFGGKLDGTGADAENTTRYVHLSSIGA